MPTIRDLVRVSQTPTLTTFHDPPTFSDKDVLVETSDPDGVPTGVTIDGIALTLSPPPPGATAWKFTGTASGFKWQVDVVGVSTAMTARAATTVVRTP